ncbi:MAG TPA: hypothetical protein P5332_11410 [Ignavibacteriales bacterium]|nr:hypothetical protein [Ignavibacteriales bacterium]
MSERFKIGGEFEFDLQLLKDFEKNMSVDSPIQFSCGRAALTAILLDISNKVKNIIYVPYYICFSVVDSCINSKFETRFYELDEHFQFPLDYLDKIPNNACLMIVNYFGLIDVNEIINKIKTLRNDLTIIGDYVQSYWNCHLSNADYSFTSLRKHFAVPDGAIVYKNGKVWNHKFNLTENRFYLKKLLGAILKFNKLPDDLYLKYFEEGEHDLENENKITKASMMSSIVYKNTDIQMIMLKRKDNYKLVNYLGLKNGFEFVFKYSEDNIPMCVPIKIKERDRVRKKLIQKKIFLPVHWPIEHYNKKSILAKEMAENVISLIIDQRYSEDEIEYQVLTLKEMIS